MMLTKELRVTADHVSPEYAFDGVMDASPDCEGGWYVAHQNYGCSKTQATAEQAARRMLAEHGCTNIRVTETVTEGN